MGRLLDSLRESAQTSTRATSATPATPRAAVVHNGQKVADVAGVASPCISRSWLIHLTDGQTFTAVTRVPSDDAEITKLMARQFGDRIASVEPWRRPGPDSHVVFGADLTPWT